MGRLQFQVFPGADEEHRWRLVAANGKIIADSAEGYSSQREAEEAVERVRGYVPIADVEVLGHDPRPNEVPIERVQNG